MNPFRRKKNQAIKNKGKIAFQVNATIMQSQHDTSSLLLLFSHKMKEKYLII